MYIWECPDWPQFTGQHRRFQKLLKSAIQIRLSQPGGCRIGILLVRRAAISGKGSTYIFRMDNRFAGICTPLLVE
jgi:hypothetical protein